MPAQSATGPEPGSKAAHVPSRTSWADGTSGVLIGRLSLSARYTTAAPLQAGAAPARAAPGRAHTRTTQREARRPGRWATQSRRPC